MDVPPPRKRRRKKWLLAILIPLLAVSAWYGPNAAGYVANLRVYVVPSGSMAPAIRAGDRVTIDLRRGTPKRGEIWLFEGPDGSSVIKRVIGLPGEAIEVAGGRVLINGQPLSEPYLDAPITYLMPPMMLQADEFFVMGDSRDASLDSHIWGPIKADQFLGRAEMRIWPRDRIGSLR